MGNETYYLSSNQRLGDVSKGRWVEMSKMMPLLLDFVNSSMEKNWGNSPPADKQKFRMDGLLQDASRGRNEIIFRDAHELKRLFAWCQFLEAHNGAFSLYKPLVETLSDITWEIARYQPPDQEDCFV